MSHDLFQRHFAAHYQRRTGGLYLVPVVLIVLFCAVLAVLCFLKTDMIIVADGQILPRKAYVSTLNKRAFLLETAARVGHPVKRGDMLARVRFEDGAIGAITALHDGVIVDTGLRNLIDGPLEEGVMIATVVDLDDLALRIAVPERLRGSVKAGAPLRYKFDVITKSYSATVQDADARYGADGKVDYSVYSTLQQAHRQIAYLGRKFPVKILIKDVSLIDYFFSYSVH